MSRAVGAFAWLLLFAFLCDQVPWWPDEAEEDQEWSEANGMPWPDEGEGECRDGADSGADPEE